MTDAMQEYGLREAELAEANEQAWEYFETLRQVHDNLNELRDIARACEEE